MKRALKILPSINGEAEQIFWHKSLNTFFSNILIWKWFLLNGVCLKNYAEGDTKTEKLLVRIGFELTLAYFVSSSILLGLSMSAKYIHVKYLLSAIQ